MVNGFLCIDKPSGPSSFDIVRIAQTALGIKKIGHSGTLDPEASGLLILATNQAPRLFPFLPSEPKKYSFSVQFGSITDTLDNVGKIIDKGKPIPSREEIAQALPSFFGTIQQKPPAYSAVKIDGKRAYLLARKNKVFDIKKKEVSIKSLTLLTYDKEVGVASLEVTCSAGTYVRSLARDIAEKTGTIGHTTSIRRLAIGMIDVKQACNLDNIEQNAHELLISPYQMFSAFPSHIASDTQTDRLSHGREITVENDSVSDILFIYDNNETLLAVTKKNGNNTYKPKRVFM